MELFSRQRTVQLRQLLFALLLATSLIASLEPPVAQAQSPTQAEGNAIPRRAGGCRFSSLTQVEPNGGTWKTW